MPVLIALVIAMTAKTTNTLITMVGLTAGSWAIIVLGMARMDLFGSNSSGALASFMLAWIVMTSAMMLPGAIPSALQFARSNNGLSAIWRFLGSYLAVWALVGLGIYLFRLPNTTFAAGPIVIAAGIYELLPIKRIFRKACCENVRSGFAYGLACVGSCIGLMLTQVSVGFMSIEVMLFVSIMCLIQKLLPNKAYLDIPLALTLVVAGLVITVSTVTHHPAFLKLNIIDCLPN